VGISLKDSGTGISFSGIRWFFSDQALEKSAVCFLGA
jgi:hypothetical protein